MPTTRPRFQVTETPEVERALAAAERAWPDASRAERVVKLLQAGAQYLDDGRSARRGRRIAAVDFSSGSLEGVYKPGYRDELRDEWPE